MSNHKKFNINEFQDGVLAEKISEAWNTVLENMQDPNCPYKPKRKIVITLTLEQNEKRSGMAVLGEVSTKLAADEGVFASFSTGKDLKTGEVWAEEYKPIEARQLSVGDIAVDDESERVKLIDFRKVR